VSFWDVVYSATAAALRPVYSQIVAGIQQSLGPITASITNTINYLIAPITRALAAIGPSLFAIPGQILSMINTAMAPILTGIHMIGSQVFSLISPYLQQIAPWINTGLSQLWAWIQPGLNQIWNTLVTWRQEILNFFRDPLAYVRSKLDSLAASLPGLLAGAVANILAGFSPILAVFKDGLQAWLTAGFALIGAIITGDNAGVKAQLGNMQQQLNQLTSGITDAIGKIWSTMVDFFRQEILPLITMAVNAISTTLDAGVRMIGGSMLDGLASVAAGPEEAAPERMMAIGFTAANIHVVLEATMLLTELIHPFKYWGPVRVARDAADYWGVPQIGAAIVSLLFAGSVEQVVRQGLHAKYRHTLPNLRLVDRMRWWDGISEQAWHRQYELQGWSNDKIDSWGRSFWTIPNVRAILTMGTIAGPWNQKIPGWLKNSGCDPETIDLLTQYTLAKAHAPDLALLVTSAKNDFVDGVVDESQLRINFAAAGLDQAEIDYHVAAARSAADKTQRKDLIALYTEQFIDGILDEQQFRANLANTGLKPDRVDVIAKKQVQKKNATLAKQTSTKKKKLTEAELIKLYKLKRHTADETKLRLQNLDYTDTDIDDLLWMADQEIATATATGTAAAA
jgi:hypothetical protein